MKSLRFLIWTYFGLLLFEGALRKWILPTYSDVLFLARDPVVIVIYLRAIFLGIFPRNRWMYVLIVIAFIFAVLGWMQLIAGTPLAQLGIRGSLKVSVVIYGWRTYFLHLPLIFLIPIVMRREDLVSFVRAMAILSVPMTLLVVAQYLETRDAWINGAAKGGEQIAFVGDKVRPSGTFSFATGPACFYALLAACGISVLLGNPKLFRWMGWTSLLCAVIYAPLSGGRLNIGMLVIVLATGTLLALVKMGMGQLRILLGTAVLALLVVYAPIFQDGLNSMNVRMESAAEFEDVEYRYGFASRVMEGLTAPWDILADQSPFSSGWGLGLGTIGGAKLQTGESQFLLTEGEWNRVLLECGWTSGMLYIIWQISFAIWLFRLSFRAFKRNNPLALMLWSANIWTFLQGQWGQPTNQGFAVLIAGLNLIACQEEPVPRLWFVNEPH